MVRARLLVVSSCFALLTACAGSKAGTDVNVPIEEQISPTATRLYMVGEEQYAKGNFPSAVLLWRHALLQLPETESADGVRHKLLLRMAHAQLFSYETTKDRTHLTNAARMLNRYAAKHETLFGDAEKAREQRGEVYEILYEVESRLEAPERPDSSGSSGEIGPVAQADVPAMETEASPEPIDTHEGEVLDDYEHRQVTVDTRNRPSVEDLTIRARLASGYATGWAGPVLTAAEPVMWNGPRPLVRLAGAPRVLDITQEGDGARAAAWNVLRAARPKLEECYGAAFARHPVAVTEATVQALVEPDGNISKVRIVEGGLVDAVGDACLLDTVDSVQVVPEDAQAVARIEVPIKFFYQGANYGSMYFNPSEPNQAAQPGLPPITEFQKIQTGRRNAPAVP